MEEHELRQRDRSEGQFNSLDLRLHEGSDSNTLLSLTLTNIVTRVCCKLMSNLSDIHLGHIGVV